MFTFDRKPQPLTAHSPALKPTPQRPAQSPPVNPLWFRPITSSNVGAAASRAEVEVESPPPFLPGLQFNLTRIPLMLPPVQRKATVSTSGDPHEREADEIADKVMRMAEPASIGSSPVAVQRKCAACEDEEKTVQAKRAPSAKAEGELDAGAAVRATERGGEPLPSAVRSYFEPRFRQDFSHIRVHTDATAVESARAVKSLAYTVGNHVVFGAGQFAPGTPTGQRLLAHELVHTIQQGSKPASRTTGPQAESSSGKAAPLTASAGVHLQRKEGEAKPDESLVESTAPSGTRLLTPDELQVVMAAENERNQILTAAIERLSPLVDLLIANSSELRPMSPKNIDTMKLIRAYLRVLPPREIAPNALEFDWLNVPGDKRFLDITMQALRLMILNRGLLRPKFHFLPEKCKQEPGLYAETLGPISLCPNFFGKGEDQPPVCPEWILTHEYFHPQGVTHGSPANSSQWLPPGSAQAIQNANALASFALALAGRNLKACNAMTATEVNELADGIFDRQQRRGH
jgi:Domain of unknown function (DUF4157)